MAIPERRRREIREREAERNERADARLSALTGLEGADPTEIYEWSRSLVRCRYLHGCYYAATCVPYLRADAIDTGFDLDMEPDTVCESCKRPLSEHATEER